MHCFDGNQWSQLGDNMVGENSADQFGLPVSLSADSCVVAVGAPNNEKIVQNGNITSAYRAGGQVRIF